MDADEQLGAIQRALVDFDSGQRRNVAIIGEPLSGKTTLLDAVITRYGKPVRKIDLTSIVVRADDLPAMAGPERITAVDDCQYLFLRRIGGFAALEKFLDTVTTSDRLYITTWNKYAWNYLEQVFALGDYFPATVMVPELDTDEIAGIIGASHDLNSVRYVNDERNGGPLVKIRWNTINISDFSINGPYIVPGSGAIGRALGEDVSDAQCLIFKKIARLSHGNPGVALAIWQKAYHEGKVRISKISLPRYDINLDPDEAFVLGNILMMKSISEEDLLKITAGHLKTDRILYVLEDLGLIRKTSGHFSVEPLVMHDIVESLKKSRQVW
jgi:hypothetical protein